MINKKAQVKICILQNGHPIADATCSVKKSQILKLSSSPDGILSLPLYPLHEEIEIVKIKNRTVTLMLNEPWHGFLTTEKHVVHLKPNDRSFREYKLTNGDYANIVLNDLRFMIKIVIPEKRVKVPLDPRYRGSFLGLLIHDAHEARGLIIGTFLALFTMMSLVIASFKVVGKRPSRIEDLESSYTLPFINEKNLVTSPEALQGFLDRSSYIASTIEFYRNLSYLFMDAPVENEEFLFPSSQEMYAKIYENYHLGLKKFVQEQDRADRHQLVGQGANVLYIPTVYGESFQQRILRTIKKVNNLHDAFELSLKLRRKTTKNFQSDPEYDWGQYLNQANALGLSGITASQEELAKISIFNQQTNEEMMYTAAKVLGESARIRMTYLERRSNPRTLLEEGNINAVYIPAGVSFASFLKKDVLSSFSEANFKKIQAVEFEGQLAKKVQEPLIGQINQVYIEKAIKKNRFQLNLCYELALRRNQKLRGVMHWVWRVNTLGKVSEISLVKSSLRDRQMINCIRRKVASWHFPRPKKGSIKISHSFEFEPQGG